MRFKRKIFFSEMKEMPKLFNYTLLQHSIFKRCFFTSFSKEKRRHKKTINYKNQLPSVLNRITNCKNITSKEQWDCTIVCCCVGHQYLKKTEEFMFCVIATDSARRLKTGREKIKSWQIYWRFQAEKLLFFSRW